MTSVRPFVTDEEFERTKSLAENLKAQPEIQKLQNDLIKRAEEKENWLADW